MAWLAIVPAAGSGSRLGRGEPKALSPLAGRPLLAFALDMLRSVPVGRTVVAAAPDRLPEFERLLGVRVTVVAGGATRAESVRRALDALSPAPEDVICIHDAARPFVSAEETRRVIEAAEREGAAIAAMPIVDTVKSVKNGWIERTADREALWAAATPQAFRADVLRRATAAGDDATDEAALCERIGVRVAVVPVSRLAFKVTTPEDLRLAEALVAAHAVTR